MTQKPEFRRQKSVQGLYGVYPDRVHAVYRHPGNARLRTRVGPRKALLADKDLVGDRRVRSPAFPGGLSGSTPVNGNAVPGLLNDQRSTRGSYFSTGTTIPRMMIFWQKIKSSSVGTAAMRTEAKTPPMEALLWNW